MGGNPWYLRGKSYTLNTPVLLLSIIISFIFEGAGFKRHTYYHLTMFTGVESYTLVFQSSLLCYGGASKLQNASVVTGQNQTCMGHCSGGEGAGSTVQINVMMNDTVSQLLMIILTAVTNVPLVLEGHFVHPSRLQEEF